MKTNHHTKPAAALPGAAPSANHSTNRSFASITAVIAAIAVAALVSGCGEDERSAAAAASTAAAAAAAAQSPLAWSSQAPDKTPVSPFSESHFVGLWGHTPQGATEPTLTVRLALENGEFTGDQQSPSQAFLAIALGKTSTRLGYEDGTTHVVLYTQGRSPIPLTSIRFVYDDRANELVLNYGWPAFTNINAIPIGSRFVRISE